MAESKLDRKLGIRTVGIREWGKKKAGRYNRYEPTPYNALDRLFEHYRFDKGDYVVDFGSGRGRVSFYIHSKFNVPVTGVEANDKTFDEALKNEASYFNRIKKQDAPLRFDYALAEQYEVDQAANVFYFFNPFSLKIFQKVMRNILKSIESKERSVDLIIYYPLEEFKQYLKEETPFEIINKVPAHKDHGKYGKFVIYRYNPLKEKPFN